MSCTHKLTDNEIAALRKKCGQPAAHDKALLEAAEWMQSYFDAEVDNRGPVHFSDYNKHAVVIRAARESADREQTK